MRLKICGLRHTDNIRAILPLQPDYLGFIFYKKSSRYAEGILNVGSFQESGAWKDLSRPPKMTGVFVNETLENVQAIFEKYKLDAVQLHGDESPEFCRALMALGSGKLEVVKVFSIGDDFDFSITARYEGVCDLFLLDTKGKERVGNGVAFNWDILKKYKGEKPFILSGGIGVEDAAVIKKIDHPKLYGVDINSRFELEPGLKDISLVRRFVNDLT